MKLQWHETGMRLYETGVSHGVLYPVDANGLYSKGYAWNGISSVAESPSGAEATPIWADDVKYLSLMSIEEYGATISAYTYPDEFMACDGSMAIASGVYIGQQTRKSFGFCYRTVLGNDVEANAHGYKLHLIYGCTASPSDRTYDTVNDTPEAIEFSWELTTIPVEVDGHRPTASVTIDSTKVDSAKLRVLEDILYGSEQVDSRLPLPGEIITLMGSSAVQG